ncbi:MULTISPECIES: serine/threonine-protein kinase [unclassified Fusibacter]|uniref:serine/threonine protein kinase n=1 Tax=unclassified Fusibacter TaxID=2624464 RepID=UPI0010114AD8|nr:MULTISPECIES: serine/threonine-protein kinase [unclassified Fusibacter]MCK8060828.1 serine/threonine protein kinase [Fusibacter sp. A2]NPE23124.1 serine/threonine protein kinase [Fusibacter sp. A1]RXV59796.1 serine/threonine protein kinase [Fusibacter sp. A1]
MLKNGQVLFERYLVIDLLGKGGTSCVYLVKHLALDSLMAMKVIDKSKFPQMDAHNEGQILKNLRHPNLPRVIDILEEEAYVFVVRDYIDGDTLESLVDFRGPLPLQQVIDYTLNLSTILNYLHSYTPPLIYRDLKPSNILVANDGQIHLIDFGTTRQYKTECEKDTVYLGTKGYAAPEQYGQSQSDQRSDVYAIGATIYFMYVGEHWHLVDEAEKWSKFVHEKALHLKGIIRACMELEPDRRIQSVTEVAERFIAFEETQALEATQGRSETYTSKAKVVVGVIGMTSGCGTTHMALAAAHVLRNDKRKVSILERHDTGSLRMLEKYLEGARYEELEGSSSFKVGGVTCYKTYSETDLLQLVSSKKENLVIDYGSDSYMLNEFLHAHIKICVLPCGPWTYDAKSFIEEIKQYDDIQFLFNLSGKSEAKKLAKWLGINSHTVHQIGFVPCPLEYGAEHDVLRRMMKLENKSMFKRWRR